MNWYKIYTNLIKLLILIVDSLQLLILCSDSKLIIIIIIIITLSTEVSERSNCWLVPYWREFLGVSGSRTWSDTPFANT